MARRAPHVGLARHVSGYTGYVERSVVPLCRREVAKSSVVMIISFGEPIHVRLPAEHEGDRHTSFVAGLHDGFVFTEHGGRQFGIQVDLTPLGAFRLIGIPPAEIAHRVVGIDALDRQWLTQLGDRLADLPDWPARFDLLDAEFLCWAHEGPDSDPAIAWAWRQLTATYGQIPVGLLADEIGWSRRHFATRFRNHVGLAPKAAARILRFQRAVHLLGAGSVPTVSAVAAACGYADHSHLVRDFHDLAGCTPTALLSAQLPDGGGFVG